MINEGQVLGMEKLLKRGASFVQRARELAIGRYIEGHPAELIYNPIGYEISALKSAKDVASGKTQQSTEAKVSAYADEARRRLRVG